jgi:hypothetical protein
MTGFGHTSCRGDIADMIIPLDTTQTFGAMVQHNLKVTDVKYTTMTNIAPSMIGNILKIDGRESIPYNRIYMKDGSGETKLYAGMHIYYGERNKTINIGTSRDTFKYSQD